MGIFPLTRTGTCSGPFRDALCNGFSVRKKGILLGNSGNDTGDRSGKDTKAP